MQAIDREIKQDFKINWPVWYALSGLVTALMVFAAILGPIKTHGGALYSIFFLAVGVLAPVATRLTLASALKDDSDPQSSWRVTDAGLQRVYRHFKPEVIEWNEIQLMKWVPYSGLVILWSEPKSKYRTRSEWFRNEESGKGHHEFGHLRTVLPVQREEGNELIRIASSKTGLTADQLRRGPGAFGTWQNRREEGLKRVDA
jgi:hypothetical protein